MIYDSVLDRLNRDAPFQEERRLLGRFNTPQQRAANERRKANTARWATDAWKLTQAVPVWPAEQTAGEDESRAKGKGAKGKLA